MITTRLVKDGMSPQKCGHCGKDAPILIIGYGLESEGGLCKFHALQLARILLEDVCELEGDRHG